MPLQRGLAKELRRYRYVLFDKRMWLRRAVFLAGALAVSVASVGFALAADWASQIYADWAGAWPAWSRFVITPAVFALCAFAIRAYFHNAQGSGIPQAIAARRSRDPAHRKALLGWRVLVGKALLTILAIAAGASVGREGPTVQIGASIIIVAAGFAGLGRERGLVLAGAGAGVAAAFNTPLAGILFAIEEMAKSYERRTMTLVLASTAIAGAVTIGLIGNYVYFGTVSGELSDIRQWLAIPICAVVGGALGALFSRLTIATQLRRVAAVARLKSWPIAFAAGCGLLVALLAWLTNDYAATSGYEKTRAIFDEGMHYPWWYAFAKLAATLLSTISGIAGGLFSPSLSVGAGLGSLVAPLLPGIPFATLSLLMMVAYFTGVVQAPLTAFVIILEMTNNTALLVPVMLTALLAAGVSRLVCPHPLYHALSVEFDPKPAKADPAIDDKAPPAGTEVAAPALPSGR